MESAQATTATATAPAGAGRGFGTAPLVVLLFAASGATGLMLEVVWSRMLAGLFGSTTWGVLTVLVVYMGGLGLGSALWGRRAARSARPLRLYGWLELGIGLYTLAVPWLFAGVGRLFVAASRAAGEGSAAGAAVRVVAAALALAAPTILMGGTLPVLTRVVAGEWGRPGRAAGVLYAANTFGAVVGCFGTGFALILWLGLSATNALAAALDLAVGLLAVVLGLRAAPVAPEAGEARPSPAPGPARAGGWAVLAVATVSGFCGLAYEVLWTRGILAALTDSTTYAFTLMLTVFLAGHALGSALASRGRDRDRDCERDRDTDPARGWRRLGLAQGFAGLAALASLPLLVAAQGPAEWLLDHERLSFWGLVVPVQLGTCLLVMFLPAALLGASFPLAARLYVGRGRTVAGSTGRLYALNTAGAIAGAVAAAVVLVPRVGTQGAVVALGVAQAAQGVAAYALGGGRPGWLGRVYGSVALGLFVAGGVALNGVFPLRSVYARKEAGGALLDMVEGPGVTVTAHRIPSGDRIISVNSTNVAGTSRPLRTTQKLQAHLPLILHPAPRSVLQIGFGSGGTCRSVTLHREVRSIEVAELSPEVPVVARRWFADVNRGALDDPRVTLRVVDARSHMAVSDHTYDLILSDSIHPRFRGNATLYSRDYFALCARRLRPGGLVSTWLPLYGMSVDDLRSVLKSMRSVFPHVQVWYPNVEPNEHTVIIGSLTPIVADWPRLVAQLADPPVAADLAEVDIQGPYQLLDFLLLGERDVAAFAAPGRLNTDDHPTLEFLAPRTLHRPTAWRANFEALCAARGTEGPPVAGAGPEIRAALARWHTATAFKLAAHAAVLRGRLDDAARDFAECARLNPDDFSALQQAGSIRRLLSPPDPLGNILPLPAR